jgi:murein DD-endopeptidase MepM/ murein hydrolase activator NlpD
MLIVIIQSLFLLKRLLAAFFIFIIYKPGRILLRFVFYKFIVKIYGEALSLMKKMGWSKINDNIFSFLLNQKLVHILVVIISVLLIFINLTAKTKANASDATAADNTILSSLITNEFGDNQQDQQLIVETFDQEPDISPEQQKYLENLESINPETNTTMNDNVDEENQSEASTIQGGASIIKPDMAATELTKRQREKTIVYTVLPGDTISTIAQEFDITVSTILWENNLSVYSIIRPGDSLSILPISGISHTVAKGESLNSIAKKYKISDQEILDMNKLADASVISVGQKLIIPGGTKINYPEYKPKVYTGLSAIKDIVGRQKSAKPLAGNKMNWPTVGYRITQYYSWRHTAVDIANKIGTSIYAADSGVIEFIGWGKGYGNQIVIDHGGGKKTRYAHLSKFYCEKGETVSKGESIAAMGSTGWSTGPHLHFEVMINGTKYNPLNYIK